MRLAGLGHVTGGEHLHGCFGFNRFHQLLLHVSERRQRARELIELNQQKLPGCYLHRSNPNDVARVEQLTFICTPTSDSVGRSKCTTQPPSRTATDRPFSRPRMIVVQAEGCAPIVRAYESGAERSEMFHNARTVADGLRVPKAIGDFLVLRAVRESGGTALAVSDADMVRDMRELGSKEGVSAAPEGGAALTALKKGYGKKPVAIGFLQRLGDRVF